MENSALLYGILGAIALTALAVLLLPVIQARNVSAKTRNLFMIITGIAFFATAFGLYEFVGSPGILPLLLRRDAKLVALKATITKDSNAVQTNPKNLDAWVELGQNFMETYQFSAAANAFKQAVLLSKGDSGLILVYAKALILDGQGQVSDNAKKSLEAVLLQDPDNPEARYFMALWLLQNGHTQEAMQAMKELYHSLPDGDPIKDMINQQIGR